jgi:hypothetical protein
VAKPNVTDIAFAVLGAVVIGVGVGLGLGFAARALGWQTGFVGPLTGGVVGTLVTVFYQVRSKRRTSGAA